MTKIAVMTKTHLAKSVMHVAMFDSIAIYM